MKALPTHRRPDKALYRDVRAHLNKAVYTAYIAPRRPKSKGVTIDQTGDGPTDGPTDRQTDKAGCRVACTRLKNQFKQITFCVSSLGLNDGIHFSRH